MQKLKQLVCSFFIAFSMYSKIPMPHCEWKKENMRYVMCFFPLIGIAIGACYEILLYVFLHTKLHGTIFASIVLLLVPVMITGGIHMDGLLDTFDAVFSYGTKEKRLEILKDSRAGAFAVIGASVYFLFYFGILNFLETHTTSYNQDFWLIIGMGFLISRTLSGLAVIAFPKAKNTGLAAMFSDEAQKRNCFLCLSGFLIIEMILLCAIQPLYALVIFLLIFLFYIYYYKMSQSIFGGITGDLAGWFLQICELLIAFGAMLVFLFKGGM